MSTRSPSFADDHVPAADPGPQRLADVTAIERRDASTFGAELHPGWSIAGRPNGGYLLAILGRAAATVVAHDHVIAASAHFLRSPAPGAVEVVAEPLREGRSASQVRARLSQDGATSVEALVTVGHLDPAATPTWQGDLVRVAPAPSEQAARLKGPMPNGADVPLLEQVDLRLEPESTGFVQGAPSGQGALSGWLGLPAGEPFDPISLLFAVDALPPATLDIAMSGWVPTLELTVYIRALPAPGPVRVLQRAGLIQGEKVDETCLVWDATGRLVAQATQLAGIRFA